MPHHPDTRPYWAKPEQASVLEPAHIKALRALAGVLGGDATASPLAVGLPLSSPASRIIQGLSKAAPLAPETLPALEPLGANIAEFTPLGGEHLYNLGRIRMVPKAAAENPLMESAFRRYTAKLVK